MKGDIVLLGAGHAHLAALGHWRGPKPPVVVTRTASEAYSGMVPGILRGERAGAEMSLSRAVAATGGRLVLGECVAIDLAGRVLRLSDGREVAFGLLSLDLGAVSAAPDGAVPVRPASMLPGRITAIEHGPPGPVAVAGAGAAGTELALGLAIRWAGARRVLLVAPDEPLQTAPAPIRRRALRALAKAGVTVTRGRVVRVSAAGPVLADGRELATSAVLWAADLAAPSLPGDAGLACDGGGFVAVDCALRSLSHPFVFAAGDCAAMGVAKSGAFAVAAGRALSRSLAHAALGADPPGWRRPGHAQAIVGIGRGRGLAWRGPVWLAGRPAWWLKWVLDQQWMRPLR